MTLRIRCQVLKEIEAAGTATLDDLAANLLHFSKEQIMKALYRLMDQDRIRKQKEKVKGQSGRPLYLYEVNPGFVEKEEKEPAKPRKRKFPRTVDKGSPLGMPSYVQFRDRKVRLLLNLKDKVGGADADLIYGILSDYGYKE